MSYRHFINYAEANRWLSFDCTEDEARDACYANPDRYFSWALYANMWEHKGYANIDGAEGRLSS